ncbi:MAG: LLM class flavin-dependent oxidoreductase [Acidisphaera sp.]|nr:LLM class flavin-dependent oxidoreductase [Acidisphaera sp.]
MKLAFYLPCYWPDMSYPADRMYDDMVRQAVLAEGIGMGSVWIPEHHFVNLLVHPSPLLTAVHVAAATKRIRIGTAILVLPLYDVRRLAGEIAQADQLTRGRLEIGVGRGAFAYELDHFGVPIEETRSRFDESLEILERLLTECNVSVDTPRYKFGPVTITPSCYQRPMPPVWMAAVQPEAIYHCAKRGYNVTTTALRSPFEEARQQALAFRRGCDERVAGTRPRLSVLRMGFPCRDRADVAAKLALAAHNDQHHNAMRSPGSEVIEGGIVPRETGRTLKDLEDALLIGTADEVLEKLCRYAEIGVDEFVINMGFGPSHRDVMEGLELLGTRIMPQLPASVEVRQHAEAV